VEANQTNIQAAMDRLVKRFNETVCVKFAAEAEQYAKTNAPWEDRTGDARKLLKGYVLGEDVQLDMRKQEDGKTVNSDTVTISGTGFAGFGVAHRVEYGKYLETANSNKYAILKPVIEAMRARFFQTAREVFGGKA